MTFQEFVTRFDELNSSKDADKLYALLCQHINNNPKTQTGKENSIEHILEKWDEYIHYWNVKFGSRDPQYISRDDAKLSFEEFFLERKYFIIYTINDLRNIYMLKGKTKKEILKLHKSFIDEIKSNNTE